MRVNRRLRGSRANKGADGAETQWKCAPQVRVAIAIGPTVGAWVRRRGRKSVAGHSECAGAKTTKQTKRDETGATHLVNLGPGAERRNGASCSVRRGSQLASSHYIRGVGVS